MIKVSVPKGKDPFEKIREDVSPEVIATSWINIQKAFFAKRKDFKNIGTRGNLMCSEKEIELENEKTFFYSVNKWREAGYNIERVDFPQELILVCLES